MSKRGQVSRRQALGVAGGMVAGAAIAQAGYDTLGSVTASGYDYSWFVTTQKIVDKEFALSGAEQNPDLTGKNLWLLLSRVWQTPEPIRKFQQYDPQDPRRAPDQPSGPGPGRLRQPDPGLYAAGEAAGFGGGGVHGYRSLEGTFLGGCLFSGRAAGRAAATATAG
ncbi:hypothetical protein Ait01nite_035700 [Actinoplanes italicus]|uniref:FAD binding domain-containing protein n=1 Tax=Actinoplanes italicus TaxID=113567 RepID=A0A2T0K8R0_9ACTN|nr:FAD-binding protein [Actinoplanes italicus]PRX19460.1 FAD binding domain-containing protein [Actinoplanes italicus]GIE30525.1 hypothetical protein Ait01nite_035700 [Actinoplanes italicus]